MNTQARITIPSLPSASEKNLDTIKNKFIDSILNLFGRDQDKEKRIRALEDQSHRGTGKYVSERYIGTDWRLINLDDGNLYLQHTPDNGETWVIEYTFTS